MKKLHLWHNAMRRLIKQYFGVKKNLRSGSLKKELKVKKQKGIKITLKNLITILANVATILGFFLIIVGYLITTYSIRPSTILNSNIVEGDDQIGLMITNLGPDDAIDVMAYLIVWYTDNSVDSTIPRILQRISTKDSVIVLVQNFRISSDKGGPLLMENMKSIKGVVNYRAVNGNFIGIWPFNSEKKQRPSDPYIFQQ